MWNIPSFAICSFAVRFFCISLFYHFFHKILVFFEILLSNFLPKELKRFNAATLLLGRWMKQRQFVMSIHFNLTNSAHAFSPINLQGISYLIRLHKAVIRKKSNNHGLYQIMLQLNFLDLFWLHIESIIHHPKNLMNAYEPQFLLAINSRDAKALTQHKLVKSSLGLSSTFTLSREPHLFILSIVATLLLFTGKSSCF